MCNIISILKTLSMLEQVNIQKTMICETLGVFKQTKQLAYSPRIWWVINENFLLINPINHIQPLDEQASFI